MYLREKKTGDLVEVLDIRSVVDPCESRIAARYHSGEELQDPAYFDKEGLEFPSGEALPLCWLKANYRDV